MIAKKAIGDYSSVSSEANYCSDVKCWQHWNETCWSRDVGDVEVTTSILKRAPDDLSTAAVKEVQWALERCPAVVVRLLDLDTHSLLLACAGMTIELNSARGLKPRREWLMTKQTLINPKAFGTPVWDAFFSWLNNDDEDRIEAMYRLLGYFLTGYTREQKVYFLYGPGRNGKTVLLELVKSLMGDYAVSASPYLLTRDQQGNRHLTELMTLRGARLGVMSELPPGSKLDVARMKYLTGGDTICARGMHRDEVNFTNTCKLIAAVNDLPEIEIGAGVAEKRRIVIIPCSNIVAEEDVDVDLLDKLKAEAPGILAKIIGGAKRYLEGGIHWTQDVVDATAEMWAENNDLEQFIDREVIRGLDLRADKNEFYQRYSSHRFNSGMDKVSAQFLSRAMKKLGHKDGASNSTRFWKNLALKSLDTSPNSR